MKCLSGISDEHVLDTCWSIENYRGARDVTLLEDDDQFDVSKFLPSSKIICTVRFSFNYTPFLY